MRTPFRALVSDVVGWLADRRIPRPLRAPVYRTYARCTGADLSEVRLELREFPSLSAFFVRHLRSEARPFASEPESLPSPVDGTVQWVGPIEADTLLQAKGRPYSARELCGAALGDLELDGGHAWTLYLSPRDYHRIHAPDDLQIEHAEWLGGARFSVAPRVLAGRERVLSVNERCALRLRTAHGPLMLVLVGALNVGRIRVVGLAPGLSGPLESPRSFARGAELARFEMGSTVVLLAPRGGPVPTPGLGAGQAVRMGARIGEREVRELAR